MKNNNNYAYGWFAIVISLIFIASAALSGWASWLTIRDHSKK